MIKERIPISGDLGSKVKQLMEYAGWQEDHPAVLPQIFRPVLRVVPGAEKAEMGG